MPLYSPSTRGFYISGIHDSAGIPADAVVITSGEHTALLVAQGAGKLIATDANGIPVAADPVPPTPTEIRASLPPISMMQAKIAAGQAVVAQVEAFMTAPNTPWAMKVAWDDANELQRLSQTVDILAYTLGWDAAQVDAFFVAAAQVAA